MDPKYRLGLAEIEVPPLRDREGDVYLLMAQFIREAASRHNRRFPELTQQDLRPYRSYHWPGNLRELRNVAEKLVIGLKVTLHPAHSAGSWNTSRSTPSAFCAPRCSRAGWAVNSVPPSVRGVILICIKTFLSYCTGPHASYGR